MFEAMLLYFATSINGIPLEPTRSLPAATMQECRLNLKTLAGMNAADKSQVYIGFCERVKK